MQKKIAIIIGCGVAGKSLSVSLRNNKSWMIKGYVDDEIVDSEDGLPVLGSIHDIEKIVRKNRVNTVIIAMPSQRGALFRSIVLNLHHVPQVNILMLPKSSEILQSDVVSEDDLKVISYEDLIGEEIDKTLLNVVKIKAASRNVLITGGAGSIGSELTMQLIQAGAKSVTVIDNSERNIFYLHQKIRMLEKKNRVNAPVNVVLGNVLNDTLLKNILIENQIDVVFHAAAYKHVYILEKCPSEAFINNVFSTLKLIETAHSCGVKELLLISTDKAVMPINVMGKSKRAAELLIHYFDSRYSDMTLSAVRFGNVFNSSGSAVELFLDQISKNDEITITDPEMKRFFMTIPEAVSLVLYSWTIIKKQKIFMFEMGDEVNIVELAKCLLVICHKDPSTYPFSVIGKKSGEKMREMLLDPNGEKIIKRYGNKINAIKVNRKNIINTFTRELIMEIYNAAHDQEVISSSIEGNDKANKIINKIINTVEAGECAALPDAHLCVTSKQP